MIPMQRDYFIESVADVPGENFVVYRNGIQDRKNGYNGDRGPRYGMCYIAAKGAVFAELFNINSAADIPKTVRKWDKLKLGNCTDEKVLYNTLHAWKHFKTRCSLLGHEVGPRVKRKAWGFDQELVSAGHYHDAHLLRPYSKYRAQIDELLEALGLLD